MVKSAEAFRSIGEVAKLIGVPPHVLRYWESQFPQLSPVKRADGRRYYRPDDVRLAAGLCGVLREDGMTARGAARLIAQDKGAALRQRGMALLDRTAAAAAEGGPARAGTGQPDNSTAGDHAAAVVAGGWDKEAHDTADPAPQQQQAVADPPRENNLPLFADPSPPAQHASPTPMPPVPGPGAMLTRMVAIRTALRAARRTPALARASCAVVARLRSAMASRD